MNREETQALLECASRFGPEYDRLARNEPTQIFELEELFHRSIVVGSKNDYFVHSWQQARLCLFRGWRLHIGPSELARPEKRAVSVDDHLAIARAIAEGEAERAGVLMSLHLRVARDFLLDGLRAAPVSP